MSLPLDHLVILVHDLEQAVADYAGLGFNVQRGGTHADGATHNALIGFADGSYLELIAFLRPAPEHRWGRAQAAGVEGLIDFALLPTSVADVVDAARARGLPYQGPQDGGRVRPDGERLVWQIGTPPSADLPFLCGDITPRALRVREGDVRVHPNGVLGVAALTLAVSDLPASLARYKALLGPELSRGAEPLGLQGLGVRIATLGLGAAALVLVSPSADEDDDTASGLRRWLRERGDGLLGLSLRTSGGGSGGSLPVAMTHGVRIGLEPG